VRRRMGAPAVATGGDHLNRGSARGLYRGKANSCGGRWEYGVRISELRRILK
jgi:hypothetical protein